MRERPLKAVRLLGQDLVLFRDGAGRWGLLDRDCPHRGADLKFARHEPDGIRCPFHGWKFAADGRCLETPAEPHGQHACASACASAAIRCGVQSGVLFAYLGPEGSTPPELPAFDCFTAPASAQLRLQGPVALQLAAGGGGGHRPRAPVLPAPHAATTATATTPGPIGRQFRAASVGDVHGQRWPMTRVMREFCSPEIRHEEVAPGLTRLTTLRAASTTS